MNAMIGWVTVTFPRYH